MSFWGRRRLSGEGICLNRGNRVCCSSSSSCIRRNMLFSEDEYGPRKSSEAGETIVASVAAVRLWDQIIGSYVLQYLHKSQTSPHQPPV